MSKAGKFLCSVHCKVCERTKPLITKQWKCHFITHKLYSKGCSKKVRTLKHQTAQQHVMKHFSSSSVISTVGDETIIRSPHEDVVLPNKPFTEFVFGDLDRFKKNTIMVDHPTGRSFTGAQLKESSIKVASALCRLGFKKGDVILIFSTNCPEYGMVFMACGLLGAVISTANPGYTPGELARQLKHCDAKAVVTLPHLLPTVKQAIKSDEEISNNVKMIISIGEAEKCVPFSNLLEDDGKAFPENVDIDPDKDVLTLPYSSGTTGLPKGVELTHTNIIANLMQLTRGPMKLDPDKDRMIGVLPFFHIYGMVLLQFGCVCLGTKLVVLPKFDPEVFLASIQEHKITYLHLVPPLVLFLAKSPLVDKFDISCVHSILSGAAPLGKGLTKEAQNRLNIEIIQAYGLTETSPVTNYDSVPVKQGTVGPLVANTQAKFIDVSTGENLKVGSTGELCVRGPQTMKGYLKNKQATDDMIRNGWLHTGDIGYADEEGYFMITDRVKELIKYKGFQIAPAELEALIYTHPGVQDVGVIGVPKGEEFGEVPRAYVVPKPDVNLTKEDLFKFVEENVAPYKKLRGGVEFVESIPKTPSGKILRRELRNLL